MVLLEPFTPRLSIGSQAELVVPENWVAWEEMSLVSPVQVYRYPHHETTPTLLGEELWLGYQPT